MHSPALGIPSPDLRLSFHVFLRHLPTITLILVSYHPATSSNYTKSPSSK
jgi:hypothetical protein